MWTLWDLSNERVNTRSQEGSKFGKENDPQCEMQQSGKRKYALKRTFDFGNLSMMIGYYKEKKLLNIRQIFCVILKLNLLHSPLATLFTCERLSLQASVS